MYVIPNMFKLFMNVSYKLTEFMLHKLMMLSKLIELTLRVILDRQHLSPTSNKDM